MKDFSFVGAGNLGVPFIHRLQKAGFALKYVYRKAKDPSLSPYYQSDLKIVVQESNFIMIAVQESRLPTAVAELAACGPLSGKIFFHTANSLTSRALAQLRGQGAAVASFSPLQTFIGKYAADDSFKGVFFLLEGDDPALELAQEIARTIDAKILVVEEKDKPLIHIGAIAGCNFVVALFAFMERQLRKTRLGGQPGIYMPLVRQTLANLEKEGILAAISGPVARGENELIDSHRRLLAGLDRELYEILTNYLKSFLAGERQGL